MPDPDLPSVIARADGTPTDEALYRAALSAGLDQTSAAALIHTRRAQATPNQIFNSIPANVNDAIARSLTHFATGIPSGSKQATAPAPPPTVMQRLSAIGASGNPLLSIGAQLATADKSDVIAGADKAVNAAAFGQGHRIAAAVQSLRDKGDLSDYRKNDDLYRMSLDEDAANHPGASLVGTTVGAIASPANRLLAPLGAVGGGLTAGAIAGSGDAQRRSRVAAQGRGAWWSVRRCARRRGARRHRRRWQRCRRGEAHGRAPKRSVDHAGGGARRNPPSALADLLPNLTRTVRSAGAKPAAVVNDALAARGATQIPTIQSALEDGLNVTRGDASASTDAIIAKRAADARQLYTQAYASPDVSHPEIAEAMKLPAFRAAYQKGQQLAAIEGMPIPKQPNPATMSVRALDYLKRGLNEVIDAGSRGGTMARGEARALNARLRTVLDAADTQAPAFAAARASFAGHSALADAAATGADFLKPHVTAGDITADLAAASPGEAQVYRTSAANSILAKIESARGSATGKADLLSKVYDSVGGKAKLRALFPTPEAADAFEAKMDRLATENATRGFVTTGSQTVDKGQSVKALAGKQPARRAR